MTERCTKAYNALTNAFFDGTLAKHSCVACACGNIIFAATGNPLTKEEFEDQLWYATTASSRVEQRSEQVVRKAIQAGKLWSDKRGCVGGKFQALEQYKDKVNEAGYTTAEFAKIENAFEKNTKIRIHDYHRHGEQAILEDQYKGLCAVVDVLIELDEAQENPDELKQKFREHPKLQAA